MTKNDSRLIIADLKKIGMKYSLDLFILFGSYAKGTQNKNSDIDLAFLSKNMNANEKMNFIDELESYFKEKRIDLVDLSNNHSLLLHNNIGRYGKIIFENRKNGFRKFKEKSFINYLDAKPWLEHMQKQFLES